MGVSLTLKVAYSKFKNRRVKEKDYIGDTKALLSTLLLLFVLFVSDWTIRKTQIFLPFSRD